jgi:CRP-like cAMP-binding protein
MSNMSDDARREILAEMDFFKGCSQHELRDISRLADERRIPSGAELCRQDDFENDVFVIVEGEAEVIVDGVVVATAGAGKIVGELSMLVNGRRSATLRVTTPMHVLVLDPREIDTVLAADPSASRKLGQYGGATNLDS